MFSRLHLHPLNPQAHRVEQISKVLKHGGIAIIPTDSCFALACLPGDKDALDRVRAIRGIDDRHHMTLMCQDLSQLANFARVDNAQYRFLKMATPGAYTFILEATKELPRRILHPKRKTIGLRVPNHPVCLAILAAIEQPLLTCTLMPEGHSEPLNDFDEIERLLGKRIELLVDSGECGYLPTTVIDLTTATPQLIRLGSGDIVTLGLST